MVKQCRYFIQESLDVATEPWGVKVERVEVKDVRVPEQLQRASAREVQQLKKQRRPQKLPSSFRDFGRFV